MAYVQPSLMKDFRVAPFYDTQRYMGSLKWGLKQDSNAVNASVGTYSEGPHIDPTVLSSILGTPKGPSIPLNPGDHNLDSGPKP